jgi:hypothetical protein
MKIDELLCAIAHVLYFSLFAYLPVSALVSKGIGVAIAMVVLGWVVYPVLERSFPNPWRT